MATKAKSLGDKVRGFVTHYGNEIRSISNMVSLLLPALPIGAQDRKRVTDILSSLETAADNIDKTVKSIPDTAVKVSKADIEAAVKATLPDILKKIMEEKEATDKANAS